MQPTCPCAAQPPCPPSRHTRSTASPVNSGGTPWHVRSARWAGTRACDASRSHGPACTCVTRSTTSVTCPSAHLPQRLRPVSARFRHRDDHDRPLPRRQGCQKSSTRPASPTHPPRRRCTGRTAPSARGPRRQRRLRRPSCKRQDVVRGEPPGLADWPTLFGAFPRPTPALASLGSPRSCEQLGARASATHTFSQKAGLTTTIYGSTGYTRAHTRLWRKISRVMAATGVAASTATCADCARPAPA